MNEFRTMRPLAPMALLLTATAPAPPATAPAASPAPAIVLPPVAVPTATPTPVRTPRPAATPRPRPSATPRPAPPRRAEPTSEAEPRSRPAPSPRPAPAVSPSAAVDDLPNLALPLPEATPSPSATTLADGITVPVPAPALKASPTEVEGTGWIWLAALGAVLALAGIIALVLRLRARRAALPPPRRDPPAADAPGQDYGVRFWTPSAPDLTAVPAAPEAEQTVVDEPAAPEAEVAPAPAEEPPVPVAAAEPAIAPAPAAPATGRAMLTVDLAARRAGLNLLSATAEVEITVRNTGGDEARDIAVHADLLAAAAAQDEALGEMFARTPGRPHTAPFALAPGEARTVRTIVTLSRAAIVPLTARGRAMFVPVVAVDVRYATGEAHAQTAGAWMIGEVREAGAAGEADKLSPFWLDAPPRTSDTVAARPHALSIAT